VILAIIRDTSERQAMVMTARRTAQQRERSPTSAHHPLIVHDLGNRCGLAMRRSWFFAARSARTCRAHLKGARRRIVGVRRLDHLIKDFLDRASNVSDLQPIVRRFLRAGGFWRPVARSATSRSTSLRRAPRSGGRRRARLRQSDQERRRAIDGRPGRVAVNVETASHWVRSRSPIPVPAFLRTCSCSPLRDYEAAWLGAQAFVAKQIINA
jgi:hypothetical protein